MATREEVEYAIQQARAAGDQNAVVALSNSLKQDEKKSSRRKEVFDKRNTPGIVLEDMARSVLPGIGQGFSYINEPLNQIAGLIPGYDEMLAKDPTREAFNYEPVTAPGRMTKSTVAGVSGAAVPIGAQVGLASKLASKGVPLIQGLKNALPGSGADLVRKEAAIAGSAALAGQNAREMIPDNTPGKEVLATGVELGAAALSPGSSGPMAFKASNIPFFGNKLTKLRQEATPEGQRALAQEQFADTMSPEGAARLDTAPDMGGGGQLTTARASGDPKLIAIEEQMRRSEAFDTGALTNKDEVLSSKYVQALEVSDVQNLPRTGTRAMEDLANYLEVHNGGKFSHKVAREWYEKNQVDLDAIPEMKDLFSKKNSLSVKSNVERPLHDRNQMRAMGVAQPAKTANGVWSADEPIEAFNALMGQAKTPRQQQAVARMVHESLIESLIGDRAVKELTDLDKITAISEKFAELWNKPGGVKALSQLFSEDQLMMLQVMTEQGKRFAIQGAQDVGLPKTPNDNLVDLLRVQGAGLFGALYNKLSPFKSMGGGLAAGSVGSKRLRKLAEQYTVSPHHKEWVRLMADPDYAKTTLNKAFGADRVAAAKAEAIRKASKSPGRFVPGLTPGGGYPNDFLQDDE